MQKININKDKLAVIAPIVFIILLGIAMANFDRIFPTPDAMSKLNQIRRMVDTNMTDTSLGTSPNASVTVIEFSDFQCPACAMAVPEVHKLIEYYGDDVNFVFKHFPAHKDSQKAAEAAECASDQGRFLDYHDELFENSYSVGISDLQAYAKRLYLDTEMFSSCLLSGEKAGKVNSDFREGLKYGIKGTPTFIINGEMLTGAQPFEVMKQVIDSELQNE